MAPKMTSKKSGRAPGAASIAVALKASVCALENEPETHRSYMTCGYAIRSLSMSDDSRMATHDSTLNDMLQCVSGAANSER